MDQILNSTSFFFLWKKKKKKRHHFCFRSKACVDGAVAPRHLFCCEGSLVFCVFVFSSFFPFFPARPQASFACFDRLVGWSENVRNIVRGLEGVFMNSVHWKRKKKKKKRKRNQVHPDTQVSAFTDIGKAKPSNSRVRSLLQKKKSQLNQEKKKTDCLDQSLQKEKVGKTKVTPAKRVMRRHTSPTEWRRQNSPNSLWDELDSMLWAVPFVEKDHLESCCLSGVE